MSKNKKILSSLSICGRITLNMHSLNNEGGEGNQILTRQVTIIDKQGEFATVNAVSGDMLKHIHAEHLWHIATQNKIKLCSSCKQFNANRITASQSFIKGFKKKTPDAKVLNLLLTSCAIDDLEGILVTNNNKNVPRKSCAEFGWLVALPDKSKTENFFHVKYVSDAGTKQGEEGANVGQNIFHRPANSGIYALVSNFDLYRISYNDISKKYAINDRERAQRYKAFLQSILYTFIKPKGAMRNTQNPHIVNFEGVIATSSKAIPAPTISPINEGYKSEIEKIKVSLNKIETDAIEVKPFNSLAEFSEKMADLIDVSIPFKLKES